jgi:WD40 repeat protein
MAEIFRFAAFLSYSSGDATFAKRLHRALEGFHIPKALGHFDLAGKPNRVYPVCRDREELAAGNLGEELQAALRASGALIVVCSPHAVASPWVDKEIRYFRSLGRAHRIFAIIADGEPNAALSAAADRECLPAALREGREEVLAGDARESKDGFRNAWLKVVAGLLSVNAGALQDRDRQQRRRFAVMVGAASAASVALIAASVVVSERSNARESFAARAKLLAERGSRAAALPFALAGLSGDRPAAQAVVDALGARLPLVAVLDAPRPTHEMQLSRDGKTFATRSGNDELALWDTTTGARRGPLHDAESFWFIGNGESVVLFADSHIEIIDTHSGSSIARMEPVSIARNGESAFTQGNVVAAQTGGDTIGVWNALSGQPVATLTSPDVALPLHLSPTGQRLLSCNDAQRCILWDVANQRKIAELDSVYGEAAFAPADDRLAARTGYGDATMWDANSGGVIRRWSQRANVSAVMFSADGTRLAIATDGGRGQLLDAHSGNTIADLGRVDNRTNAVQFSADGSRLMVIGPNATGSLWDARAGGQIASFSDNDSVNVMQSSRDGSRLVIQSFDQKASIWDGLSGRKIADLGSIDPIESVTFSTPPRLLLVRTQGAASLWTHDGRRFVDFGIQEIQELALRSVSEIDIQMSEDGQRIAALDAEGLVRILNSSQPPITGEGETLRQRICAANGRVTPAFRREDREADDTVARHMKGRPWNMCDWRGLSSAAGWFQTLRYWAVRSGLAKDYAEND